MLFVTTQRRAAGPNREHVVASASSEDQLSVVGQLLWFSNGLLLFFLVPWVVIDKLRLDNDFYYSVFIWVAMTFLGVYVRVSGHDVSHWFGSRWRSSLFVGVLVAIYIVALVLDLESTNRPTGLLLMFEVAWRGIAYGVVQSLVLTAFPVAIAFGLFGNQVDGFGRRVAFAAVAAVLVWIMAATYHLGFQQFEADDLAEPEFATTVVSVPALVTANPAGSILAQVALHVAATLHVYETGVFAPPAMDVIREWRPPGVFRPTTTVS